MTIRDIMRLRQSYWQLLGLAYLLQLERLIAITDASGTTSYEYSPKGQVTREAKVIDGVTYTSQYSYNLNGDVTSITYPAGRVVDYSYASGLMSGVTTTAGGTTTALASNIQYQAFGGIKSLVYGNGLNRTITYDNQGRIRTIVAGGIQNLTYAYDANSNITGITNNVDPAKTKTYAYDALDRLTGAIGPWGTLNYTYDGVGNRKTETTATGTTSYTYTANKLMSSSGDKNLSFGYDSNGNTIAENGRQYVYNQNQRLIKTAEASSTLGDYVYNANGQRAKKVAGGVTTVYHFNVGGQLIGESDNSGNVIAQYVYLNGQPIAKIDSAGISYIHTDHLGTPTAMTNAAGAKVWEIESQPFGDAPNITGSGNLNLRFPGQYFDPESGLHYNYFRDYEPRMGRYVEADPIGLRGGINPFYFVGNNPVNFIDQFGLASTKLEKNINVGFQKTTLVDNFADLLYAAVDYRKSRHEINVSNEIECAVERYERTIPFTDQGYEILILVGTKPLRFVGMIRPGGRYLYLFDKDVRTDWIRKVQGRKGLDGVSNLLMKMDLLREWNTNPNNVCNKCHKITK
ncbi:MAG: RHS domain-containing protein [Nitrospirae bacterium]|nr:RHS domain-containing protein [Nitrospirota bacterium]